MADCAALLALAAEAAGRDGADLPRPRGRSLRRARAAHGGRGLRPVRRHRPAGHRRPTARPTATRWPARRAGRGSASRPTTPGPTSSAGCWWRRSSPTWATAAPTILCEYPDRRGGAGAAQGRTTRAWPSGSSSMPAASSWPTASASSPTRPSSAAASRSRWPRRQRLYGERYPLDEDFLAALAQMPPASGGALGFDRLVMLATGASRIEQVLWTPVAETPLNSAAPCSGRHRWPSMGLSPLLGGDRMLRTLAAALGALLLAAPAAAQVVPVPAGLPHPGDRHQRHDDPRPRRRARARRSCCCTAMARPATCGRRSPPTWRRDHTVVVPDLRGMGLSAKPAGGYDKKTQGEDVAGVLDALKIGKTDLVTHDIGNMVGYAFAAAAPRPGDPLRADRRAAAGRRPVGGDPQEPAALALPLRRPGHGAAGGRPRAHLPRPLLERVLRRRRRASPRPRASTTPRSTPCPAPCTPASRSSPPSTRTPSTTRPSSPQGKLDHAGAGAGRREVVRPDHGRGHAVRGQQRDRRRGPRLRPLDHGGEPQGDHRPRARRSWSKP